MSTADDLARLASVLAVLDDYTEPTGRIVVEPYEVVELRGEIIRALRRYTP